MKYTIRYTTHAKEREVERNSIFGCYHIVDIDYDINWGLNNYKVNKVEYENDLYLIQGRHYKYIIAIKNKSIILITILYKENLKKNKYRKYSSMTKQSIKLLLTE
jgi:hypothetical protein